MRRWGIQLSCIIHSFISCCLELRALLKYWYSNGGLAGAVLIGQLPVAYFHHDASSSFNAETFPCDLYLMDLDGEWYDTDFDGTYDCHTSSKQGGDIYPEIFVGRIDPSCLSWGGGTVSHICGYLTRLHDYRRGLLERSNRALMYVDDDWSNYWGFRWSSDLSLAFSNQTLVLTTSVTTADDWLHNRLPQNYKWTHLCVHSSPTTHYFGPSGIGEGIATSAQIRAMPPAFSFYNLFACSAAKWTSTDCLAATYVFSSPYGLAAIGSTKTGSMMDCEYFYQPLGLNETLGVSLREWFCRALSNDSTAGEEYLEWYYGMCILGDPLLRIVDERIVFPPSVSSPTHPHPFLWYNNNRPVFVLTPSEDVHSIVGCYYLIDHDPSTVPTAKTGVYTTDTRVELSDGLDDGIWYFHAVACDSAGNVGRTAGHIRFNIDRTAPTLSLSHKAPLNNCSSDSIELSWSVFDSMSGYSRAQVWVDDAYNVVYEGIAFSTVLIGLTEGIHIINVTVFDKAGNTASQQSVFQFDMTAPVVRITRLHLTSDSTMFELEWQVIDSGTGYRSAEIWTDGSIVLKLNAPNMCVTLNVTGIGSHYISVIAYDWVNHSAADSITVFVSDAFVTSMYVLFFVGGLCAAPLVVSSLVVLRHRAVRRQ